MTSQGQLQIEAVNFEARSSKYISRIFNQVDFRAKYLQENLTKMNETYTIKQLVEFQVEWYQRQWIP